MNAVKEFALRSAARMVMAALLLALVLQSLAMSRADRDNFWLTGSLCARTAVLPR